MEIDKFKKLIEDAVKLTREEFFYWYVTMDKLNKIQRMIEAQSEALKK